MCPQAGAPQKLRIRPAVAAAKRLECGSLLPLSFRDGSKSAGKPPHSKRFALSGPVSILGSGVRSGLGMGSEDGASVETRPLIQGYDTFAFHASRFTHHLEA